MSHIFGPIRQLSYVVQDIDAAIRQGATKWCVLERLGRKSLAGFPDDSPVSWGSSSKNRS